MQRVWIFTADASLLESQLESALDMHEPDVVALTGIGPARASCLAGAGTSDPDCDGRATRKRREKRRGRRSVFLTGA